MSETQNTETDITVVEEPKDNFVVSVAKSFVSTTAVSAAIATGFLAAGAVAQKLSDRKKSTPESESLTETPSAE